MLLECFVGGNHGMLHKPYYSERHLFVLLSLEAYPSLIATTLRGSLEFAIPGAMLRALVRLNRTGRLVLSTVADLRW
jgi:hypothetical protein